MSQFLQYGYVFLWAILAALSLFIGRKQGLYGYFLSGFFVFLAIWYGLRAFGGLPVFEGLPGYIFRGALVVFLLIIVCIWKKSGKENHENKSNGGKK